MFPIPELSLAAVPRGFPLLQAWAWVGGHLGDQEKATGHNGKDPVKWILGTKNRGNNTLHCSDTMALSLQGLC